MNKIKKNIKGPADDYYHQKYFTENSNREYVWQEIIKYLHPYWSRATRVLELGAGYCHFINNIPIASRVAVDHWPGIKKYAGKNVDTVIVQLPQGLKTLDEHFDLVVMSNFLEHLSAADARELLAGLYNILDSSGRLIIIQPNFRLSYKQYFDDYTHRAVYTDVSLKHILTEEGFEVVHSEPAFLPYSFKSRLPKWPFLVRAYLALPFRPMAGQMLLVAQKNN